jgi:hypothetical protein
MNEDELDKIKELVSELFEKFGEHKGIVSLWTPSGSQCFSNGICMHQLYDVMLDISKRLSMLPPNMPELIEGHHILKCGSDIDDLAVQIAMHVPMEHQSIIVVFGDREKEEGDTVFCMGPPSTLTMLALRGVVSAEEMGGAEPHAHPPSGTCN